MPVLREPTPGALLPMRVVDLPDTTVAAGNWALWLRANNTSVDELPGPWLLDIRGNTVTQDTRKYGAGALSLILRLSPTPRMMTALHLGGYLACSAEKPSPLLTDNDQPRCVVLVDDTGRHPGEHTDGVTQWGNTAPYVEGAPPPAPERPVRRVGILLIPEEDLENLAKLAPGQRITGLKVDHMRAAVLLRVEGPGMPEIQELSEPPIVDALRYRPPPLVERVDVERLPPALQHAVVLQVLAELIEHAGHLGSGCDVRPDLSVNAHATWIGADEIVRRHAPDLEDRGAYQPSTGTTPWCQSCTSVIDNGGVDVPGNEFWPCPDYRAAAQGAVTGLVNPDDE